MIKYTVIAMVLLQSVLSFRVNSSKKFILHKSTFDVNPMVCENATHSIKADKSIATINMDGDIIKDLKNLSVYIGLFKMDNNDGFYKIFLVNDTVKICDFVKKNHVFMFSYFVQKIHKILENHTNAYVCIHKVKEDFL